MTDAQGILGVKVDLTLVKGSGLVAKDGGGLFGKAKSSDPFIRVTYRGLELGCTPVISKTLDPEWNHSMSFSLEGRRFRADEDILLSIYDKDKFSKDDPMGEVRLHLSDLMHGRPIDKMFPVNASPGCTKVSGQVHVKVAVTVRRALSLNAHEAVAVEDTRLAVGLGWDMLPGNQAIDLDASCVAISRSGNVMMDETVYFGQLKSKSGAIRHTGDEKEGDEDLGQGDDEIIVIDVDRVPHDLLAVFFVATVATEGRTFADVKGARIRLVEWGSGVERVRFMPAMGGAHTALFMARLARDGKAWKLTTIGEFDHTARDWGSVMPELRAYMGDLVPGIKVNPSDRVAIMHKGGTIRLRDYCAAPQLPQTVVLGLHWDVTDGVNIDLDASVIMLDANLKQLDLVFFQKLVSSDGAVRHGGDEREGDEKGDDEKIFLELAKVHPAVAYIGLVINSYSGQELDDVKDAGVHLFDAATARDIFRYEMTNTKELDKHTALVMAMLYREGPEWCARIISEPAQGRTAHDNVDELQRYIKRNPITPLPPPREFEGPGAGAEMVRKLTASMAQAHIVQMTPVAVPMGSPVIAEAVPIS
ncbi:hypothetical protein AB1Y20_005432 [Prymnesium parvum]|uniref:C2 domain-containing protein n=1 Tax=Prymnesium parvum TaxID=97485 RepID=A0AB34J6H8_PRYPA